jgi:hypothetical protein
MTIAEILFDIKRAPFSMRLEILNEFIIREISCQEICIDKVFIVMHVGWIAGVIHPPET